jgi:superfamily II DNA helicase RecQ
MAVLHQKKIKTCNYGWQEEAQVIVATNAFEWHFDKANVKLLSSHCQLPENLEKLLSKGSIR